MPPKKDSLPADIEFKITPLQQAAASCTGAIITSLLVTPLDVVKIRLQSQRNKSTKCFLYCNGLMDHICSCPSNNNNKKNWYSRPGQFKGTVDAFYKIARTEGVSSLWSGLGPTLVLAIPATIAYFVTYEQIRIKLKEDYRVSNPLSDITQPYWIPLIAGGTARIFSVSIVSPLELIRTKMQSQRLSYFAIGEAIRKLVQIGGVQAMWMGIIPTLLRDVPFSAIYWTNYETLKTMLNARTEPNFSKSFICGGLSGMIAAIITTPFDVVKTHQQIRLGENTLVESGTTKYMKPTTFSTMKDIIKNDGLRGFFSGLFPRVIKVAPSCAIMISTFEYGKLFFNRSNFRM